MKDENGDVDEDEISLKFDELVQDKVKDLSKHVKWRANLIRYVKYALYDIGKPFDNSTQKLAKVKENTTDKLGIMKLGNLPIETISRIVEVLEGIRSGAISEIPDDVKEYFSKGDEERSMDFARADRDTIVRMGEHELGVDGDISSNTYSKVF